MKQSFNFNQELKSARELFWPFSIKLACGEIRVERITYEELIPFVKEKYNEYFKNELNENGYRLTSEEVEITLEHLRDCHKSHSECFIFWLIDSSGRKLHRVGWSSGERKNGWTYNMGNTGIDPSLDCKTIYKTFLTHFLQFLSAIKYQRVESGHSDGHYIIALKKEVGFVESGTSRHESHGKLVVLTYLFAKDRSKAYELGLRIEQDRLSTMKEAAQQVAHDIRAPLAALDVILPDLKNLSDDKFHLAYRAIERIRLIANDILDTSRDNDASRVQAVCISSCLDKLSDVANVIYPDYQIKFNNTVKKSHFHGCEVKFVRIISNLISNAVEASLPGSCVRVCVEECDHMLHISIIDNGRGIPKKILKDIGCRGLSYGKKQGNGLGVFHARKIVNEWGGELKIVSELGVGTTVQIILSKVETKKRTVVLLDDDPLVGLTWQSKAHDLGVDIHIYDNPEILIRDIDTFCEETEFYIDSELADNDKGEDTAKILHGRGVKNIFMATGYDPESFSGLEFLSGIVGKKFPE